MYSVGVETLVCERGRLNLGMGMCEASDKSGHAEVAVEGDGISLGR